MEEEGDKGRMYYVLCAMCYVLCAIYYLLRAKPRYYRGENSQRGVVWGRVSGVLGSVKLNLNLDLDLNLNLDLGLRASERASEGQ